MLSVILNTLEGALGVWTGSRMCARVIRTLGQPAAQIAPLLSTIKLSRPLSVKTTEILEIRQRGIVQMRSPVLMCSSNRSLLSDCLVNKLTPPRKVWAT